MFIYSCLNIIGQHYLLPTGPTCIKIKKTMINNVKKKHKADERGAAHPVTTHKAATTR